MTADPQTLAFYDQNAAAYAEFADPEAENPWLAEFLAELPEAARVLDLGCGTGWAAAAMIDAGHQVDAMDASAGLAAEAAGRHGLEVKVAAFRTLSRRARYDAIWSHFALQHAERNERPQIFERIAVALKPGGLFCMAAQKGPRDWRDTEGRLYCPFREEDLAALFAANGLTSVKVAFGTGKMYDGTPTLNIYAMARHDG